MRVANHFSVLDSFRGICACIVAMSHFHANSIFHDFNIFSRGSVWVDFFFVLSGFVIFANYRDRLLSGYSIKDFIFLRLARLYPLHIAVFLAFILADVAQYFVVIDGAALHPPFSAPGEGPDAIIANVFLIHSLGVLDRLSFNGPSWSISVEFFTYILFAFILCFAGKYYRYFVVAVSGLSVAIVFFNHSELFAKLDFGFFRCVYGFGCGALVWEVYERVNKNVIVHMRNKKTSTIMELFFVVLMLAYVHFYSFEEMSFFIPIVFGVFIFLFAFEAGVVSQILRHKFFLLLGTLSYSIYMIHIFISGKFFDLPIRLLESKAGWEISVNRAGADLYGKNLLQGTVIELFYLLIVIGCSYISYRLIEETFRKASKNYIKNKNK